MPGPTVLPRFSGGLCVASPPCAPTQDRAAAVQSRATHWLCGATRSRTYPLRRPADTGVLRGDRFGVSARGGRLGIARWPMPQDRDANRLFPPGSGAGQGGGLRRGEAT